MWIKPVNSAFEHLQLKPLRGQVLRATPSQSELLVKGGIIEVKINDWFMRVNGYLVFLLACLSISFVPFPPVRYVTYMCA